MDKQITFTKEELQEMLNKAADGREEKLDNLFMGITGCDAICSSEYDKNIRNGIKKTSGLRNILNHLNLQINTGFDILRDLDFIEYHPIYMKTKEGKYEKDEDGNRVLEWKKDSNGKKVPTGNTNKQRSRLTSAGFRELNGLLPQSKPMIKEICGNIYVDESDIRYKKLVSIIEDHSDFSDEKIYNKALKERKTEYNRHELKLAEDLRVEIIEVKEITDES